ncbi:MAG TPA: cytochrome c oxidase subunit I [Candidatus Udaeobacter sp.]|jgi:cytochrome c oxidase subunit 1/cytochrome c oxidase subunit I+III
MNGTDTISEFRDIVLDPAKRRHYQLAWLSTVDHKRIGVLYMLTGLFFLIVGGLEALVIRLQLAVPNNHLVAPDTFNQLFTMHGTTMIFLVAMPLLFGFVNYILPLQIGARDMAFPRLNAFGYWCQPFGGILLHFSILAGGAPAVGWFSYAPLSETPYSSSPGVDYWAIAIFVLGLGTISFAVNTIATVISCRAPGMTMRRLPLFTWMNFINSFLILIALPVLNAGLAMILIDRRLDGHFFLPFRGGSAVLWQHIFWAFGHPEVYIVAVPAFGMIAEMIPVFSRKPIFGYEAVAASTVAIVVLSSLVWGHHMFTVGMGRALDLFFIITSMLIAIPTGVKVLNWSATMVGGRIRFSVPMLFCIAFLIQFTCAGLTGISHASAALDWQTKNSYFLVAHFHFVFVGAIVFAMLGALPYWFPKMSGRMMSESLGKWTFWLWVIGFNMTFIIQHVLGLYGMPRRIFTYPDIPGWGWMNMVSTVGVFFMGAGSLVMIWNIAQSFFRGKPAGDNPWDAWTLEWATTSPPPHENFLALPPIHSRRPLWDIANPDRPDPVVGDDQVVLPDHNKTGILAFLFSEVGFFGVLILAYLFFYAHPHPGPGPKELDVPRTLVFSVCLFASSLTFWRSEVALHKQRRGSMLGWLGLTIALGAVFLGGQANEYWKLFQSGVDLSTNMFSTTFFTLTGFHGVHVLIGLITLLIFLWLAWEGDSVSAKFHAAFKCVGYYWHFVDVVWVFVLFTVYLLPLFR